MEQGKNRITIALQLRDKSYKLASLMFSTRDASFFLYIHCIVEDSPIQLQGPIRVLTTKHAVRLDRKYSEPASKGSRIHVSFHPEQIHVCRQEQGGKAELLVEAFCPQRFARGYRLLGLFSSPHPKALPRMRKQPKKDEEFLPVVWTSPRCPQFSIYELESGFSEATLDQIDPGAVLRIPVGHAGRRLVITCKETGGDVGAWRSNLGLFGTPKQPKPMSKTDLQRALDAHELPYVFDISSLPDDAKITSVRLENE